MMNPILRFFAWVFSITVIEETTCKLCGREVTNDNYQRHLEYFHGGNIIVMKKEIW